MMKQTGFNGLRYMAAVVAVTAGLVSASAGYDNAECIRAIRLFADTVIERGADTYGDIHSPLFVDGLHVLTLEPVRWAGPNGQTWVLSNFASQQPLMRLLDGLTTLTGQAKYRRAAEAATAYTLETCRAPNGLLYWGGHLAWDLESNQGVGQTNDGHELKTHQPYFELMWRVDSEAARKLAEAIWARHIIDWPRLDYNRHGNMRDRLKPRWDAVYEEDITVPFATPKSNLSFVNVTPPLMRAGVAMAVLDQSQEALLWTDRLVERWQQAEDPNTALSGGQLSYRQPDRAQIALGHVHPSINEAKIVASYHQTGRYHDLPLAQMQAAEMLIKGGSRGAEVARRFIAWACEDLKAYVKCCYDPNSGRFIAVMVDGTPIQWQQSGSGYYVPQSFAPRNPDGSLLWGCALGYRLTEDAELWRMTREICRRFGLGDIGRADGADLAPDFQTNHSDWQSLYALLELYRATGDEPFMRLARRIGDNLLRTQAPSGLFPRQGRQWARTGDEVPLALLHLAAAEAGKTDLMPQPVLDSRFFHCQYHQPLEKEQEKRADNRTYDHLVFYGQ